MYNDTITNDNDIANKSLEYGYKSCMFAWVPLLGFYYALKGFKLYFKVRMFADEDILRNAKLFCTVGLIFQPALILACNTVCDLVRFSFWP